MGRRFAPILLAATICGSLVVGLPVLAQDDADDEPDQRPKIAPARSSGPRLRFSDRQIDRWLFGLDGDVDSARLLSESRLKSRIDYIDRLCSLTPDQRKKLELAGRGDIKRFFDQVAERKKEFHPGRKAAMRSCSPWSEVNVLGKSYRSGLFGGWSCCKRCSGRSSTRHGLLTGGISTGGIERRSRSIDSRPGSNGSP